MQHVLIDDSPSHALHKLGMWNGVEGNRHTLPTTATFQIV
jgi:hypothetical protein